MKNRLSKIFAFNLIIFWAGGCNLFDEEKPPDLVNQLGIIKQIGIREKQFVIYANADTTIAYLPTHTLPEPFRKPGLPVIFSGNLPSLNPLDDGRYLPLEVTAIATLNMRAKSRWQIFASFWR